MGEQPENVRSRTLPAFCLVIHSITIPALLRLAVSTGQPDVWDASSQ